MATGGRTRRGGAVHLVLSAGGMIGAVCLAVRFDLRIAETPAGCRHPWATCNCPGRLCAPSGRGAHRLPSRRAQRSATARPGRDGGRTRAGGGLRLLTKDGLASAAIELDRGPDEMGGMPESAGRSGASHAMTVNETVIAMIRRSPTFTWWPGNRPKPSRPPRPPLTRPTGSAASPPTPPRSPSRRRARGRAPAWEVRGRTSSSSPRRWGCRWLPLLFIETDNCFEDAPRMGVSRTRRRAAVVFCPPCVMRVSLSAVTSLWRARFTRRASSARGSGRRPRRSAGASRSDPTLRG